MKKIITLIILGFLILSSLSSVNSIDINLKMNKNSNMNNILYNDSIDQYQIISTNATGIGRLPESLNLSYNITYAQSFIPQKDILSKIEINITRNETTVYDIIIAIRDNLTGEDLVYMNLNPIDILIMNFSFIEFDFEDIYVKPGQTYYIVAYTTNFTENWYLWAANNDSESYPYGCAWMSIDDGDTWTNESISSQSNEYLSEYYNHGMKFLNDSNYTWDLCFKTYGRDNLPPEALDIDGEIQGKIGKEYTYELYSLDPEGDAIYYFIDWDDNNSGDWIGPFSSEEVVYINHTWSVEGNYTIAVKAKDSFGAESEWIYLEISMPLNLKTNKLLFLEFIKQRFPLINDLLYKIFELLYK